MESFNVELKLTVDEAKKLSEVLRFKVATEKGLIDHYVKRLKQADDLHGNPKEFLAGMLDEHRGEHKQNSYLLGVIDMAIKDAQERTDEPF
jgi:hypothetical protein